MDLKLITIGNLAKLLQCTDKHLRNEIKRKNIKAVRIGNKIMFTEQMVNDYIKSKTI